MSSNSLRQKELSDDVTMGRPLVVHQEARTQSQLEKQKLGKALRAGTQ